MRSKSVKDVSEVCPLKWVYCSNDRLEHAVQASKPFLQIMFEVVGYKKIQESEEHGPSDRWRTASE